MRLLPRPNSAYSASLTSLFLLLLSTPQLAAAASAVLGIDLGQEFIKAALVKPGIPLEIVLTKDTKRKETSAVGFKPAKSDAEGFVFPERLYGADAANLAARFPGDVYPNLKQLLGKHIIDDEVQEYSARYPALNIHPNTHRPSVLFHSRSSTPGAEGERAFTVEELLAMQLRSIKRSAEAMAGPGAEGTIQNVVFTVPAFFNAEERYALTLAAELAGLKVMNIMSDGLAIAVNYATAREFPSDKEPEAHIIYDMGAGSTTATVVQFAGKKVKDYGTRTKDVTEVTVLGVGWDEGLGGDLFNKKLTKLLLDDFIESQGVKQKFTDPSVNAKNVVRLNGKTAAKLWREATKIRHVLSANTETSSSVESLYDDLDFRSSRKFTRPEFEASIAEYTDRITGPIDRALKAAGLKLDDIRSLIVHGGGVRVPFVGKLLEGLIGEGKISRTVNSDEAAVMGATFRGAALSNSFKVRDIYVKDADVYPVTAKAKAVDSSAITKFDVFPAFSTLSSTKVIPVKLATEFDFELSHILSSDPPRAEKVVLITTKNLTATAEQLLKDFGCTSEHVRTELTVRLSERNGLPEVTEAYAGCDIEYEDVPDVVESKKDSETGKEKGGIVDDVKGFFGLNKKKDQAADPEKAAESNPTPAASASSDSSADELVFNVQEGEAPNLFPGANKKYITKFEKIPVEFVSVKAGFPAASPEAVKVLTDKLNSYDNHDREIIIRDTHFNTLESLVYKVREYLGQESSAFLAALEPALHHPLTTLMDHLQGWLYDGGESASSKILEDKLAELNKIVEPARRRMEEALGREPKVKRLQDALNQAGEIGKVMDETLKLEETVRVAQEAKAEAAKKAAEEAKKEGLEEESDANTAVPPPVVEDALPPSVYSAADYAALKELLESTKKWIEEELVKQEPLLPHEDPILTLAVLDKKIGEVNHAVMNILQRGMKRQEERNRLEKEKEKERERAEKKEKREKEKREKEERKKRREEEKKAKEEEKGGKKPQVTREEIHEEL